MRLPHRFESCLSSFNTSMNSMIDEDNKQPVQSITPDWTVPAHVKVYSTTRLGGVSESPYDTLNLGLHVKDKEVHVLKNRELMLKAIKSPEPPLWLNQVHGNDVYFIDSMQNFDEPLTADGSFTRDSKRVLSILTADCLPVVIANAQGTSVAVMHAGWKGLATGVLQSGLRHFSEEDELHAWLGPAIGPDAFEVGMDVVDAFLKLDRENASAFKPIKVDDANGARKFMADIYQLAKLELNRHRRVKVTGGEYCTYTDRDLFHSFRRDGARSGRMATLVWID